MNNQEIHALVAAISNLTEQQFQEWFAKQAVGLSINVTRTTDCLFHRFVGETLSVPPEAKLEFTWEQYELNNSGAYIAFPEWMRKLVTKIKKKSHSLVMSSGGWAGEYFSIEQLRKILQEND